MPYKRKIDKYRDDSVLHYATTFKAEIDLIQPKNLYLIVGRGGGKTSDIAAERAMDICYDMPGAPFCMVGDTYVNLKKNIIRTFLEGWDRKGWVEGVHYVVEEKPPQHFKNSFNKLLSYKHTICVNTGSNFTIVSLENPSAVAGNSYVHLFADEVKYNPESKMAKLTKANRGYSAKFRYSPYYLGHTFTTDMPDVNQKEFGWILKTLGKMNKKRAMLALQTGLILNEIKIEYVHALDTQDPKKIANATRKLAKWEERHVRTRKDLTLAYVTSSLVNLDILTTEYFFNEVETDLLDVLTGLFSIKPKLRKSAKFYNKLEDRHFYYDGYDKEYYKSFSMKEQLIESSLGLSHCRHDKPLACGVDFGNMNSMYIGQIQGDIDRGLKFLYVLVPEQIPDLAEKFRSFFKHHRHKKLIMRYDRAGNNMHRLKEDWASWLKKHIEYDKQSKSTGWIVQLESIGQANIYHEEEYMLVNEMLSETNDSFERIRIDAHNCAEIKCSLELAPSKKDGKGNMKKVKTSERKPTALLPRQSTNASDAFKYYICTPERLKEIKSEGNPHSYTVDVR